MSATEWGRITIGADETGGNPTFNAARRIPKPAGSANLYPNFSTYKKFMTWDPSVPVTRAQFMRDRIEGMKQIEKPIRPLVRRVLDSGKIPYSSNYYGPGVRGVHWRDPISGVKGFTPYKPPSTTPPLSGGRRLLGGLAGGGAAANTVKTMLGFPIASAITAAPATSALLVAGAGAAGAGLGYGLNRATGGALVRATQQQMQPYADLAYGVEPKPDPVRDLWLGIHRRKR